MKWFSRAERKKDLRKHQLDSDIDIALVDRMAELATTRGQAKDYLALETNTTGAKLVEPGRRSCLF